MLGIFKKLPCWKRLVFSETSPIEKIISMCVGTVLWCVNTLSFFKVSLCVGPVLWCVGTLSFFKISLCVGPVVGSVGTLSVFLNFPVCGPCDVVCGDFEFFQSSLCVCTVM